MCAGLYAHPILWRLLSLDCGAPTNCKASAKKMVHANSNLGFAMEILTFMVLPALETQNKNYSHSGYARDPPPNGMEIMPV